MSEFIPLSESLKTDKQKKERIIYDAFIDAEITYKKLCKAHAKDLTSVFGTCNVEEIINKHSVFVIKANLDAHDCFKYIDFIVGEVVCYNTADSDWITVDEEIILTRIDDNGFGYGFDKYGFSHSKIDLSKCKKVGKYYSSVKAMISDLGGEE